MLTVTFSNVMKSLGKAWDQTSPFLFELPPSMAGPDLHITVVASDIQHHTAWDLEIRLPAGCLVTQWHGRISVQGALAMGSLTEGKRYLLRGFCSEATQYITVVPDAGISQYWVSPPRVDQVSSWDMLDIDDPV